MLTFVVNLSWRSTFIIALEACLKLELKDRPFADPDVGTGLSYMVGEENYKTHIAGCEPTPPPKEVNILLSPWMLSSQTSTCGSMLHAVNEAHTSASRGYLAAGVVILLVSTRTRQAEWRCRSPARGLNGMLISLEL